MENKKQDNRFTYDSDLGLSLVSEGNNIKDEQSQEDSEKGKDKK